MEIRRRLKQGLTLMEITIAMVISTVVLGGLFALMANLQQTQLSTGQLDLISGSTQACIKRIIKDAAEAVGDQSHKGIYLVADLPGVNPTFCIHKYLVAPSDKWVCYWQSTTEIKVCEKAYNSAALKEGACNDRFACPCQPNTEVFVASALPGTLSTTNPTFIYDSTIKSSIFTIKINNRAFPSEPADPNSNPSYSAQENVVPAGYSL